MNNPSAPPTSVRLRVEGHVQGVGFRYSTLDVARQFRVTGYVMNLPDGAVEIVAEGPSSEVAAFLAALRRMPVYRNVTRESLQEEAGGARHADFRIRFV